MTAPRLIAFGYAVLLFAAASLNYIPGVCDAEGRAFGIFALDPFDDGLHIASALWALTAGFLSNRAARIFLVIFGALYLGDGVLGFFTGYGYLDAGIFRFGNAGMSFTMFRLLANMPHIVMGGFALFAGLRFGRE
jgi:hypothetical protein